MIVLDASVVVELLIGGPASDHIRREIESRDDSMLVPYLLDVEVMNAIRSLTAGRKIPADQGEQILEALVDLPAQRCPHTPLLDRAWELRHNFTAYDAIYIALAEATKATLYTKDKKLAKGHRARVTILG